MFPLLAILVVAAVFFLVIVPAHKRHRHSQMVAEKWAAGQPDRVSLEFQLPFGEKEAKDIFGRATPQLKGATDTSKKARKNGLGTLGITFLAWIDEGQHLPTVHCRVICDADKQQKVSRVLMTNFPDAMLLTVAPELQEEIVDNWHHEHVFKSYRQRIGEFVEIVRALKPGKGNAAEVTS
jgi:hypothetical protein